MIARRRKHNFTIVANKCVNDKRLSLQAKGLMLIMMSNDLEWDFYLTEIVKRSSNGIDGTRSALHELEKYNYLFRYRERNENGTLGKTVWDFDDEGGINRKAHEKAHLTNIGFSNIGLSNVGKSNTNKNNNNNTNSKKTNSQEIEQVREDKKEFMSFINSLRENLRQKGNDYPTLVIGALKLGFNSKNLLYDKLTQRILSGTEAVQVYKHAYNHYTGNGYSTKEGIIFANQS